MTKDQQTNELYRLAKVCAISKNEKQCNMQCASCYCNILAYGIPPQEAMLIRASAELDARDESIIAHNERQKRKVRRIVDFIVVGTIVGLIVYACAIAPIIDRMNAPEVLAIESTIYTPEQKPAPYQNRKKHNYVAPKTPQWTPLRESLELTHANIFDIDENGVINCVDYAVIYHLYFGTDARIIGNRNPHTGMNHLFNYVRVLGDYWEYLEPQATNEGWMMPVIWGDKYNPAYNVDETDRVMRIINGYEDW